MAAPTREETLALLGRDPRALQNGNLPTEQQKQHLDNLTEDDVFAHCDTFIKWLGENLPGPDYRAVIAAADLKEFYKKIFVHDKNVVRLDEMKKASYNLQSLEQAGIDGGIVSILRQIQEVEKQKDPTTKQKNEESKRVQTEIKDQSEGNFGPALYTIYIPSLARIEKQQGSGLELKEIVKQKKLIPDSFKKVVGWAAVGGNNAHFQSTAQKEMIEKIVQGFMGPGKMYAVPNFFQKIVTIADMNDQRKEENQQMMDDGEMAKEVGYEYYGKFIEGMTVLMALEMTADVGRRFYHNYVAAHPDLIKETFDLLYKWLVLATEPDQPKSLTWSKFPSKENPEDWKKIGKRWSADNIEKSNKDMNIKENVASSPKKDENQQQQSSQFRAHHSSVRRGADYQQGSSQGYNSARRNNNNNNWRNSNNNNYKGEDALEGLNKEEICALLGTLEGCKMYYNLEKLKCEKCEGNHNTKFCARGARNVNAALARMREMANATKQNLGLGSRRI